MGLLAAGRRRHLLVVLTTLSITAAACSGGDDAASTTTLPVTTAPTTPATTSPPTTTVPPTTAPPATTQPPTTAPVTTGPPAAVDPAAAEAVLPQLIIDYIAVVNALSRNPGDEGLRASLAARAVGYPLDLFIERADEAVLDNKFSRADPVNPSRVEPIPATFAAAPNGEPVVAMDGCVIDTDSQVTLADDGSETAVESTPDSLIITFTFSLVGDRWLVTDIGVVEQYPDQVGCG